MGYLSLFLCAAATTSRSNNSPNGCSGLAVKVTFRTA